MKKQLLGLMIILTILNACQKNEVSVSLPEEVTIHATIEDKNATKTIMDESNNILWTENDQIIAFMKSSYGHKYQVKPSFVGKSYADFSMVSSNNGSDLSAGNEWEHNVVYYPYSEDIECLKSGANYALEVNLPAEQTYVPDSFANGSMAMVAVSESNNITFKNILGGIKLQLKGTQEVASIKIEGKNNEKLAGAATVTVYTDENKPAITMASSASTSVTLNCGEGVQLNESTATEFIISLPPVLLGKGFKVTVTDSEREIYNIETDKANTILRSSLLIMPTLFLSPLDEDSNDDIYEIHVTNISLNSTSLSLAPNTSYLLEAKIAPLDATNKTISWSSDNPSIVSVDQTGLVSAHLNGSANITAVADVVISSCLIKVIECAIPTIDYIDEYNINHGKGIAIASVVWAPVNCGYKSDTYPYGKHYQWGRKYGQGLGSPYDSSVIEISEGPVSLSTGQKVENENVFYKGDPDFGNNWLSPTTTTLWNSGTAKEPIKSEYDPCPLGWRVPTSSELSALAQNWTYTNMTGHWFRGPYSEYDGAPKIFITANGCRTNSGWIKDVEGGYGGCYYWSSSYNSRMNIRYAYTTYPSPYYDYPASAFSIRCVQE